jgi:hypothetical protein
MQRKLPAFGFPLQVVAVRPTGALASGPSVPLEAIHPDASGFQLRSSQARSGPPVEILESIDTYGLHGRSCFSRAAEQYSMNACSSQVDDEQRVRVIFLRGGWGEEKVVRWEKRRKRERVGWMRWISRGEP